MMTAKSMLSRRTVLKITVVGLFFLLNLFSSHIYCAFILFLRKDFEEVLQQFRDLKKQTFIEVTRNQNATDC